MLKTINRKDFLKTSFAGLGDAVISMPSQETLGKDNPAPSVKITDIKPYIFERAVFVYMEKNKLNK